MHNNTLIVGCSYVSNIKVNPSSSLYGTPGSGNTAIASRVLEQLSKKNVDQYNSIVVLWSGINRIDCPVNLAQHSIFRDNGYYPFVTVTGDIAWYHSGGIVGSWMQDEFFCPKTVNEYFSTQYKGSTSKYLTDLSLREIVGVQNYLESQQIEYKMSFIYDIHSPYTDSTHGHLASVCGQVDTRSIYYSLVNWEKFEKHTPYEWCYSRNLLDDDQWHWTHNGAKSWFNEVLELDLNI